MVVLAPPVQIYLSPLYLSPVVKATKESENWSQYCQIFEIGLGSEPPQETERQCSILTPLQLRICTFADGVRCRGWKAVEPLQKHRAHGAFCSLGDTLPSLMSPSALPGEYCEVNARSGRCAPGVCKNGGTCINLLIGGFKCECPPGEYERPYCEMTTRSFPPQSFITFKGLRQRFHFTVSLM